MRNKIRTSALTLALLGMAGGAASCAGEAEPGHAAERRDESGVPMVVSDTQVAAVIEAAGTAAPIESATLGTRLMATVLSVSAREGDMVAAGTALLRLDSRDLDARAAQVNAQLSEARAVAAEASTGAQRFRRLYAESVATRAQLDGAETGLARAEAAVRMAEAAAAEVAATSAYAVIQAPFTGTVTARHVDPGAMAAPGAPLLTIENSTRLRISAAAAPASIRGLRTGQVLEARIEGVTAPATIEGMVPAPGGATWLVNAVVENASRTHLPGSAAILLLPQTLHRAIVVPASAITTNGDLTAVRLLSNGRADLRWVRLGRPVGPGVEVTSGLQPGDTILVPAEPR